MIPQPALCYKSPAPSAGKMHVACTTNPPLTTSSQPVHKIAATAFTTLLARIRYPNNDPHEIYLVAPLVARQST